MKTTTKPGSRQLSLSFCPIDLFQRCGALPGAGSVLSKVLLILCLCLSLPALPVSCSRDALQDSGPKPEPPVVVDSVLTRIRMDCGEQSVRRLDLFIYSAGGTRPLEHHLRYDALPEEAFGLPTLPGEKILVGIANSPHDFNLNALARYDAMEQLAFLFSDDDPAFPVLGGRTVTVSNAGEVRLTPLLCRVRLSAVSNSMDGYELLEDPAVRLCDMPNAAEILREKDFRPTELIDSEVWTPLPYDVGFFTQEPGIELWCYPNDTPETTLGVPRPTLEFRCRIRGGNCSFQVPLPPLPRASSVDVELTIDGPGSLRYKVRQTDSIDE